MKNKILKLWLRDCAALGLALLASNLHAQTVTTIGGGGPSAPYSGYQDGLTLQAKFNQPSGLAMDPAGNYLFVADYSNNVIRIITQPGNTGSTTTTFSNSFSPSVTRGISRPISVLVDGTTNVYVLNQGNGTNGTLLQFSAISLGYPTFVVTNASHLANATAMAMDGLTNLFVTVGNNTVLRITPPNAVSVVGVITNPGTCLQGIAVLDNGQLALSDAGTNSGIWLMNPYAGNPSNNVTKLAGFNGVGDNPDNWPVPATDAIFNHPANIAKAGNGVLVVDDTGNNRVKLLNTISGTVTLLYGVNSNYWGNPNTTSDQFPGWLDGTSGILPGYAESRLPSGVVVATNGSLFIAEDYYHVLRHVTGTGLSAPQPGYPPTFNSPQGIAFDSIGNNLFIADSANNTVRQLNLDANVTSTFLSADDGLLNPVSVLTDTNENVYVLNQGTPGNGFILEFDIYGNAYGPVAAGLNQPTAFTLDGYGNLFVTEQSGSVRAFGMGMSNIVATITNANVSLQGIAIFDDGNLAVSDAGNHVIWTINPITKLVTKLTGQLGLSGVAVGASNFAKLYQPHQLARAGGNQIVAADYGNNRLVLIQRNGTVSTNSLNSLMASIWFGQNGDPVTSASPKFVPMVSPSGVAVGNDGEVFTSETYYEDIRGLTGTGVTAPPATPIVTLPYFNYPAGIAVDSSGSDLFIADFANNAVERLNFANNLTTAYLTTTNGINHPIAVLFDTSNNLYVLNQNDGTNGNIVSFSPYGCDCPLGTNATGLNDPTAFTLDANGNIFVAEQSGNICLVYPSGVTDILATITNANVSLQGIALFDDGSIAVSDAGNQVIWTVNTITKNISILTGQIGSSGATIGASNCAKLFQPHQMARAGDDQLVLADTGNNRLVTVGRDGSITNVLNSTNATVWFGQPGDPAPNGSAKFVPMTSPIGVAVGSSGSVFASETYYPDIRGLTATVAAPTPVNVLLPAFLTPSGMTFDPRDNYLFIADPAANLVKLLDLNSNLTSVFLAASNGLSQPVSVLVDTGKYIPNIYVLDQNGGTNGTILAFDIYGNPLGTIASGLNRPTAFTEDAYGNFVVAEQTGAVCLVNSSGKVSTLATLTNVNVSLQGVALFDDGTIAVSDADNQVIWTVNAITKTVSLLTGQIGVSGTSLGSNNVAKLNQPLQLARVGGDQLLVADFGNNRLITVTRNGYITNVLNSADASIWFGQNGDPVTSASPKFVPMVSPSGVAVGNDGEVFTSETYYQDIRGLIGTDVTSPTSNPGVPLPIYSSPTGIALNNENTELYIADPTNNTISQLNLANNRTTVFLDASSGIYQPVDVALDSSDNLYVLNQGTGGDGSIFEFDKYGNLLGTNAASLSLPTAMKLTFSGDIYVSELNGAVQKFNSSGSNTLTTIATNANVELQGIAVLDNGSVIVSDAGNQVLWKIAPTATNAVLFTGVLGSPGTNFGGVGFAKLNQPMRLAQANGGLLLIADSGNNRVVVADDQGTVSTTLNSTNATLWFGLPIDPVSTSSPNFISMLSPVGLAIGTSGTVFASENIYKDIRGLLATGIQAPVPPPPAPLNLMAAATYGQVTLAWSAANGATNYNVKRSTSTNATYTLIGSTIATDFTDTNVLGGSTYYYVVSAVNAGGESPNSAVASVQPPLPPVPAPQIGYVDFPATSTPYPYTSVFHPVASFVLNNDTPIVIVGEAGSQSYYTYGPTTGSVPDPTTNSASAPVGYQDGDSPSQVAIYSINPLLPDVTLKAFGAKSDGSPNSAIVQARFQFVTANPTITGDNAAQFTISDVTANAHLYYTVDGSDPSSTNGVDLGTVATQTNVWTVGFSILTNTLFKVVAVRDHYQPSAIVSTSFSPSNFVANVISFGFASGEASSDFVAAPGQTFYAPVTLSTLPNTTIYSLQFNLTATNAGPNPGPAIAPDNFGFQSMLMKPVPNKPGLYVPIPPYAYVTDGSNLPPTSSSIYYEGNWFESLVATNSLNNLLAIGWLERAGMTNLYDTTSQDLIAYSIAHDVLHTSASGSVELGGYVFGIPAVATNGQTYQIQIGRPSATSDGIGAPGSDVFIAAPTNGSTAGGGPVNALKVVTVGQRSYLAGSVYPFRWFNAGDFGSSNIVNADVEQVFQSAIYGLNSPPPGSDFFDAMDSCGGTYVDLGHGYLEFNSYISGPGATNPLFDGNDTSINQIAFGDGVLDVCDVYVTFRRSLDPSLTWFQRYWNNGQRVAEMVPNVASHLAVKGSSVQNETKTVSATNPQVNFTAVDVQGSAGQTIQVPIDATIFGSYPLRVLMLNLTVSPLDGSPDLAAPIQFTQTATVLGTPLTTDSDGNDNFSAVWLNSTNAGLTGAVTIGTLTVTIPAGASTNAAYAVHFDHASASPNGLASFPKQTLTGLITLASHTNSSYADGIPDSWRLRWFGTVNNLLSISNACPSGDGVNNWMKYVAGVDPNTTSDFPSVNPRTPVPSGSATAIHWPTVSGKQYVIERSSSLFSGTWTAIGTNTGTGTDMEFNDNAGGNVKFYRVQILP